MACRPSGRRHWRRRAPDKHGLKCGGGCEHGLSKASDAMYVGINV